MLHMQRTSPGGPVFTYTVPENRVLIVNAWVVAPPGPGAPLELLRGEQVVVSVSTRTGQTVSVALPTGIAFFAGDTLRVDLRERDDVAVAYGYLQPA